MAVSSESSLLGVPVPWVLIYEMSPGVRPADFNALDMAKNGPSPFSDVAV